MNIKNKSMLYPIRKDVILSFVISAIMKCLYSSVLLILLYCPINLPLRAVFPLLPITLVFQLSQQMLEDLKKSLSMAKQG